MKGIFLDTETNGLNPDIHRPIEIAFKIFDFLSKKHLCSYESIIYQPREVFNTSDPDSLKINGFTEEMLLLGKSEQEVAHEITTLFEQHGIRRKKAVFVCQNPSFDRIFFTKLISQEIQEALVWPYHWLDLASMYWALAIEKARQHKGPYPWETGFTKNEIAKALKLPEEKHPHRAMNGVNHLLLCYENTVGF